MDNNTDNLPIYQNGITLSPHEEQTLVEKAWSQSRTIAKILQWKYPDKLAVFEMYDLLQDMPDGNVYNERSVQRAMSSMTGTKNAPEKYKDQYGNWILLKLDEKRLNPDTNVKVHLYCWNPKYKKKRQPHTHQSDEFQTELSFN